MARKKYLGLGVGAQCFPLLKSLHPQNIIQEDFPIYAAKERGHRDQEKERSSYSSGGIFFEHLQFQGREIYCAAGMRIQLRRVIQKIFSIIPLLPKLRLRLSKENHATILAQKFSKWATIGKILPQFELKASTLMTTMNLLLKMYPLLTIQRKMRMMASTLRRLSYLIRSWIPRTTMDGRNLQDFSTTLTWLNIFCIFFPVTWLQNFLIPKTNQNLIKLTYLLDTLGVR